MLKLNKLIITMIIFLIINVHKIYYTNNLANKLSIQYFMDIMELLLLMGN